MNALVSILASALVSLVDPFVGTDFTGHTFPGAAYPFGMLQLSPDTRAREDWETCSGYHYSDSTIYGFSQTHLSGTGCNDLCDIQLVPGGKASSFSHDSEKASPGYYEVFLEDTGVKVRLAAGRRVGMHEYTFPAGVQPVVKLDLKFRDALLDSSIDVRGNVVSGLRRSRGWAQSQDVYYYLEFSAPVLSYDVSDGTAMLHFAEMRKNVISVRVGISSVSVANAGENLRSEKARSIESLKKAAGKAWEAYLGKLSCPASADPHVFYTALYHTAIHPSLYSDANGEYRGMDRQVHKADGWERYTVFSLWDTFRALHPLLTRIEPERTVDFIRTFLSIYDECGKLPIWELWGNETNCMIGYNSAPVIAEALAFGIDGFDVEAALEALVDSSVDHGFGLESYRANGLVIADDEHESVSKTLEYAFDDWCVAQVAKWLMDHPERCQRVNAKDIYDRYMVSAQYWRNVFDPSTGFMRPRINGHWLSPFNPREVNNHFTEANSWQYSFFVPQDIAGLMDALGGRDAFCDRLDALFTAPEETTGRTQADITGLIGQYAHGNEPSHHVAFLYSTAGRSEKTDARVREIMETLYTTGPAGLCGNEDCGQMSAWYVMSALGWYRVTPGLPEGADPVTSIPQTIVVNPVFEMENDIFADSLEVRVGNIQEGCTAWYRTGDGDFRKYEGPFVVRDICRMEVYSEAPDGRRSFTTRCSVGKIRNDVAIDIHARYNRQYNAGGDSGLIDGVRGGFPNWRTGGWQGYQGTDFEAVIDLLQERDIKHVSAGFCQDARSWIWMPRYVEFSVSDDGKDYRLVSHIDNTVDDRDYVIRFWDCGGDVSAKARYVKVYASNYGEIPSWHPGAGGQGFIFIDEIDVR